MADTQTIKTVAARNAQSKASKRATLEQLLGKRRREKTLEITVDGRTVEIVIQALSAHEMDALQAKHTPTTEQKARGMAFNPETFAPALVAACSKDPLLSEDDVKAIWNSEAYSAGELSYLFNAVSDLCMEGLNVPFNGSA